MKPWSRGIPIFQLLIKKTSVAQLTLDHLTTFTKKGLSLQVTLQHLFFSALIYSGWQHSNWILHFIWLAAIFFISKYITLLLTFIPSDLDYVMQMNSKVEVKTHGYFNNGPWLSCPENFIITDSDHESLNVIMLANLPKSHEKIIIKMMLNT